MIEIDLNKTAEKEVFKINKSSEYNIVPNLLKNTQLKRDYIFHFESSNIKSKITYKCVAKKDTVLDLNITLSITERGLSGIEAFLEIYVLNLDKNNIITVKPFLEIPEKNIQFEHKVTIGAPNKKWIKYLNSRGLGYEESVHLISDAFITG